MSRSRYSEDCAGCLPALVDENGRVLPDHHPLLLKARRLWHAMTPESREALHQLFCMGKMTLAALIAADRFQRDMSR